jgi:hypothetical protein
MKALAVTPANRRSSPNWALPAAPPIKRVRSTFLCDTASCVGSRSAYDASSLVLIKQSLPPEPTAVLLRT